MAQHLPYSPLTLTALVERAQAADGKLAVAAAAMVREDGGWDVPYWRREITKLVQESDAWWSAAKARIAA